VLALNAAIRQREYSLPDRSCIAPRILLPSSDRPFDSVTERRALRSAPREQRTRFSQAASSVDFQVRSKRRLMPRRNRRRHGRRPRSRRGEKRRRGREEEGAITLRAGTAENKSNRLCACAPSLKDLKLPHPVQLTLYPFPPRMNRRISTFLRSALSLPPSSSTAPPRHLRRDKQRRR